MSRRLRMTLWAYALLSVGTAASIHALPITVSFTASSFPPSFGTPAPTDPVTGSLVYDAASSTSNINSLSSVNLTIDGHTYILGEVGFISAFGGTDQLVGGVLNGVTTIFAGTNDFVLRWNETTLAPISFTYSSTGTPGRIFNTGTFTQFGVTSAVPEPRSLVMVGAGIVVISFIRRSRISRFIEVLSPKR